MTDLSSSKRRNRKKAADAFSPDPPSKSSKVTFLSPSLLLLEVPADTNTSLPVWDAVRSQQVDVAWGVNPYGVNIHLTPIPAARGKTASPSERDIASNTAQTTLPPSIVHPQMIIRPIAQQSASTQNTSSILLTFPQNNPQPPPSTGPPGQLQDTAPGPVMTTSLIVSLPVIITQPQCAQPQPSTPAKKEVFSITQTPTGSPAKPPVPRGPVCPVWPYHTNGTCNVQICDNFLLTFCRTGWKCKMHHTPYPFHWQLWCVTNHQYVDFPPRAQTLLERIYCDVNQVTVNIKDGCDVYTLDFQTMELNNASKYDGVRRLSNTDDPAKNPYFPSKLQIYWYNLTWQEYTEDVSKLLLKKMKDKEPETSFHIGGQEYKVDFTSMTQTNQTSWYQRGIRCRPAYRSAASMEPYLKTGILSASTQPVGELPAANFSVDPLEEFSCWYPPVWSLSSEQDYSLVDVPAGTPAYQKVQQLFYQSLPETKVDIIGIQQIQNLLHWDKFQRHKSYMLKCHTMTQEPLERHLFHGTTEKAVEDICHNNFDPRVSGVNGVAYGCGSYFSCSAEYSNTYSAKSGVDEVRHMFLAKVLVGKVSLGKRSYHRPPPLSNRKNQYRLYDTCVDQLEKPSIFVVFDSCQCYPYYLIKYKDLPKVIDLAE